MKPRNAGLLFLTFIAVVALSGCDQSGDTNPAPKALPARPAPTPLAKETNAVPISALPGTTESPSRVARTGPGESPPIIPATENETARELDLLGSQLTEETGGADPILAGIGRDVRASARSLALAVPGNEGAHAHARSVVQALLNKRDQDALDAWQKLSRTGLTPEQGRLARNFKDAVAAFVVQRAFSDLAGAGNEVAQIVTAMRQGDATTSIQALQTVTRNAPLRPDQKEILSSLVRHYTPGVGGAIKAPPAELPAD